jgi:hypothetical protein
LQSQLFAFFLPLRPLPDAVSFKKPKSPRGTARAVVCFVVRETSLKISQNTPLTNALLCGIIRVQEKKKEPALPAVAKEVNNGI